MTFMSGVWFYTFSTTVFRTVVKNVLDRQTLYFTVAFFFHYEKQYTFSNNSNETRRNWGTLAAPDFANSGKKHMHFPCSRGCSSRCSRSCSGHCRRRCRRRCQKTMMKTVPEDGARRR